MSPFGDARCRVLVAEPDADTRELYETALAPAGWEVIAASDGRDALTKALIDPPTLIVSELRLPFIDGGALCAILRRDAATQAVPILIVTGEARATELTHVRNAGADAVLVKPTTPEAIVTQARRLAARGRELRQPSTTVGASAAERSGDSVELRERSATHRTARSKSHHRFDTTTPAALPPPLTCPSCDRLLKYDHSHIGGVSDRHAEQWDYYTCSSCGSFQYRQRTRKLRRVW